MSQALIGSIFVLAWHLTKVLYSFIPSSLSTSDVGDLLVRKVWLANTIRNTCFVRIQALWHRNLEPGIPNYQRGRKASCLHAHLVLTRRNNASRNFVLHLRTQTFHVQKCSCVDRACDILFSGTPCQQIIDTVPRPVYSESQLNKHQEGVTNSGTVFVRFMANPKDGNSLVDDGSSSSSRSSWPETRASPFSFESSSPWNSTSSAVNLCYSHWCFFFFHFSWFFLKRRLWIPWTRNVQTEWTFASRADSLYFTQVPDHSSLLSFFFFYPLGGTLFLCYAWLIG